MEDKKLFPELPEDLSKVTLTELQALKAEHDEARALIQEEDASLAEVDADYILAELERGKNQNLLLVAEIKAHEKAHEAYLARKAEIDAEYDAEPEADEDPGDETSEVLEVVAEEPAAEDEGDGGEGDEGESSDKKVEERELVLASAEPETSSNSKDIQPVVRFSRTPPAPAPSREIPEPAPSGNALVAAGEFSMQYTEALEPYTFGELVKTAAMHYGPHPKIDPPGKYRFGGPETKIAKATLDFPEERTLGDDQRENKEKISAVVAASIPGGVGQYSLTASGGLCAPAEPFYSLVNFATTAEPVWDSLPIFAARRGAVNVPESTYIADITTAISSISEANDALGGTFATKSCQALDCLDYTETAVNIIAHCREYGNLNARSWPELIAHENDITMAAMARTSEEFILERIKALSVNVTSGANTLSALTYLVDAITKSAWGIRGRFRMPANARFRALIPAVLLDMLLLDGVQNPFNLDRTRSWFVNYLSSIGVDAVVYLDGNFTAGDDMLPDASQAAGALDPWPNTFQWALFPEGAFLGIDMGVLELGIVRDSVLNSTNDFQVFGERFRNVVRLAPAQACYWETTTLCAVGTFPPAGTARTCES